MACRVGEAGCQSGEFPAQGGRVDAELVTQRCHWFAWEIPTCGRCEKLIGVLAHRRSARHISTLEVS